MTSICYLCNKPAAIKVSDFNAVCPCTGLILYSNSNNINWQPNIAIDNFDILIRLTDIKSVNVSWQAVVRSQGTLYLYEVDKSANIHAKQIVQCPASYFPFELANILLPNNTVNVMPLYNRLIKLLSLKAFL